ncbi:MAG: HEAT repeat domain-containing protein, partial [Gemmatimonadota bacterium]
ALWHLSPAVAVSAQMAEPDSLFAVRFLAGVRSASPLACDMIVRSLSTGWGWSRLNRDPDAVRDRQDVLRWATGRRSDPSVIPPLRAGLEDSDACVRRVSARLLGRTRHPGAVEALLDALASPNVRTRQLAAVGLGYAEDRSAVDPLLRGLRDDAVSVRAAAAWALGEIEDGRAVAPLARLLRDDPDPGVRRAAALALGSMF